MSRLIAFLDRLSDEELAFFHAYRKGSFMPDTEARIAAYFDAKGLPPELMREMVANGPAHRVEGGCPRCGSDKRDESEVTVWNTREASGIARQLSANEHKGTMANCAVCGMVLADPNSGRRDEDRAIGFVQIITRFFGG